MSVDLVDDLHAAEERIGALEALLDDIAQFARRHPWTGLADAHGHEDSERLLSRIQWATESRYERPTCEDGCCDEFCGSPAHYDQTFNETTGEWEDDDANTE